ncbi:ANTAR domain-containing protein [Specibacter sp. NPDC057265]|uniref:ANTAR domain-containing protein n=1 Tax=Specibacter sp. NPDC057265 TaxID=3346075 RepID=UPI003624BF74
MAADLQAAMASRTVIDLAIGVIMGQQRCSQAEAFQIISRAASARNQKLHEVAASLLLKITGETVKTHFDH